METYAVTIYVISDEVLKSLGICDNPQSQMSNAEVITFTILAAKYFSTNFKMTRYMCKKLYFFPNILSNSRLNRRIHHIPWNIWNTIFHFLGLIFKKNSANCEFIVDSFPLNWCEKSRIDQRKAFLKKGYIGYAASKKRYFCGIKVHMIVTNRGWPVEVLFRPGADNDLKVLWQMQLNIPSNSKLYADGAYNCFELEDILKEEGIKLLAKRGKGAKNRVRSRMEEKEISSKRQMIETVFSSITGFFPRNLRACTESGFFIKVFSAVLAYSFSCLFKVDLN